MRYKSLRLALAGLSLAALFSNDIAKAEDKRYQNPNISSNYYIPAENGKPNIPLDFPAVSDRIEYDNEKCLLCMVRKPKETFRDFKWVVEIYSCSGRFIGYGIVTEPVAPEEAINAINEIRYDREGDKKYDDLCHSIGELEIPEWAKPER